MANRASVVAFALTLVGTGYQMVSFSAAYLVDRQFPYYYYIGIYSYFNTLTVLVLFWAAAHLLDKQDSRRATWPALIITIGYANLANLVIAWFTPANNTGFVGSNQNLPADIFWTVLPAPLLLILGAAAGFLAARHPRQAGPSTAVASSS